MRLRKTYVSQLIGALDRPPHLTSDDFDVSVNEGQDSLPSIDINYRLGEDEKFTIAIAKIEIKAPPLAPLALPPDAPVATTFPGHRMQLEWHPGEGLGSGSTSTVQWHGVVSAIGSWVTLLVQDLVAAPVIFRAQQNSDRMKLLEELLDGVMDEHPTADQVAQLEAWIATIEAETRERIDKLEQSDDDKAKKLEELERTVEFLRQRARSGKVKDFFRAAGPRLWRLGGDQRTAKAIENISKFLGMLGDGT